MRRASPFAWILMLAAAAATAIWYASTQSASARPAAHEGAQRGAASLQGEDAAASGKSAERSTVPSAQDNPLGGAQAPAPEVEWTVELYGIAPSVPWTQPLRLGVRTADGSLGSEQFATVAADGTARFAPPTDPRLVHLVLSSTEPNYRLSANTLPYGVMQRNQRARVEVFPQTILRGRVTGPDGAGVGAARVRAFVFRGDYPAETVVAETNTDREGNYELLAPPSCPLLIVARAMEPENPWMRSTSLLQQVAKPGASLASLADNGRERTDLLPAGVRAQGTHGTQAQVPDVQLRLPSAIRGSVLFPDGSKPEGALIVATPADVEPQHFAAHLHWSTRQGMLAGCASGTDWKGSFELPLAADTTWQVTAMLDERDLMLAAEPSATVRSPGHVDLVLPSNPITVQARAEGKPAADAVLQIDGLGEFALGPTGERRLVLGATTRRLRARTNVGTSAWVPAPTTGAAATVVLEVSASTDAPVEIVLSSVPPVFLAHFHFRPKGAGTAIRVSAERRLVTDPFAMRVPPADYDLDIFGNEDAVQGLYMLPLHLEVNVPVAGLRRQDEVAFGGRLVLDVHDELGVARAGTFSLFDAAGKPVVASFVSGGRDDTRVSEAGHFFAARMQTLSTVLPAGKYLLAVECAGLRSAQQEVTVRPREVANVTFRLR